MDSDILQDFTAHVNSALSKSSLVEIFLLELEFEVENIPN